MFETLKMFNWDVIGRNLSTAQRSIRKLYTDVSYILIVFTLFKFILCGNAKIRLKSDRQFVYLVLNFIDKLGHAYLKVIHQTNLREIC